ncbi:transglycosylase [Enterococcus faecium]|nr:CHAP domain-containing protein [Enterococcus faecium]EGP5096728.1 transglycosylase [Enterococcus faecium]EGP5284620.1 transglycosylase [Enterococcus faecium]
MIVADSENPRGDIELDNEREDEKGSSSTSKSKAENIVLNRNGEKSSKTKVFKTSSEKKKNIRLKKKNGKKVKLITSNTRKKRLRAMLLEKRIVAVHNPKIAKQQKLFRRRQLLLKSKKELKLENARQTNQQHIIQREKPNEQTYRNSVISDKQTTQVITRKQKYQKQFLQKELKYTGYVSEAKKASLQQKQATVTRQAKSTQFSTQSYKRKYQRSTLSAQSKQTGQTSQKYKRQSGRASTYSVKNMKHKVDRSLQRNISPKNRFRSQIKELVIDKVGRDGDGNLNLIGLLIALFILVPILLKLIIIITIVAIVITVITVVISIFMFIASLFVIKTEDMALEEAYRYVTHLDALKNKNVYNAYQNLINDDAFDEVYFMVNGVQSDPETFLYSSNGDSYLYYLNAKFEDYDIDELAIAKYRERIAQKTGQWIPNRGSIYAIFADAPYTLTDHPVRVNKVRDEILAIHDMVYNYSTLAELGKQIETTTVTIDEETGEEKVEVKTETKDIVTININIQTLGEMLDSDPEVDVYTMRGGIIPSNNDPYYGRVSAFDEEEVDKYYPISDLDRFENKIFLLNPFGATHYASVIENYGYRGRNPDDRNNDIVLEAEPGTPVYAMGEETIDGTLGGDTGSPGLRTWVYINEFSFYLHYRNINLVPGLRSGQRLSAGDLIGYTRSDNGGNLLMDMELYRFWHADPPLYPAVYIDNLSFAHETNLGYFRSGGGLRGELINPPASVTKWREKVAEETKKNDIEGYENAILSIIWVETGGNEREFPDIMQASESQGRPPNSIRSPEESIEVGVRYFARLLKKAQENQKNERAAVQAYNFGEGYLDDLIRRNSDYSFDDSRIFARDKSNGKTVPYHNPIALRFGYTWRYDYGNMFYAQLVTNNIMVESGRMVEIAREELGNLNGDKYWRWFGFENRAEWSAMFVSWVADQARYINQNRVLKTPNVLAMRDWFYENEKFKRHDEEYLPQSGDLIFFDWTGGRTGKDFVGIVEYAGGGMVQVIEGNSDNRVRRRTYALDSIAISGYGTP